jgi:hypothetical protein
LIFRPSASLFSSMYLRSCASCSHIDTVNLTLLNFQAERQHLEDRMFLHPLCSVSRADGNGPGRGGGTYRTNACSKSQAGMCGRFSSITRESRPFLTSAAAII